MAVRVLGRLTCTTIHYGVACWRDDEREDANRLTCQRKSEMRYPKADSFISHNLEAVPKQPLVFPLSHPIPGFTTR